MQKKFSFDAITNNKILKGALIALSGSAGIGLLSYLGTIPIKDATISALVAWAVPTMVNIIKEWMAGK